MITLCAAAALAGGHAPGGPAATPTAGGGAERSAVVVGWRVDTGGSRGMFHMGTRDLFYNFTNRHFQQLLISNKPLISPLRQDMFKQIKGCSEIMVDELVPKSPYECWLLGRDGMGVRGPTLERGAFRLHGALPRSEPICDVHSRDNCSALCRGGRLWRNVSRMWRQRCNSFGYEFLGHPRSNDLQTETPQRKNLGAKLRRDVATSTYSRLGVVVV